jgi:hypothetical protein
MMRAGSSLFFIEDRARLTPGKCLLGRTPRRARAIALPQLLVDYFYRRYIFLFD